MEKVMITVIPTEKETRRNHKNYRPICSFPMLYKLILHDALQQTYAKLDSYQFPEQAGSRWKLQTTDHLMTYRLDAPESRAWETDMWVVAIVFQKAFDSIQHDAMWRSLRHLSISEQYICLLKKVAGCMLINVPPYWRTGTQQGDPLSSLLFNSVLQSAMEKDIETWNEKGLGI